MSEKIIAKIADEAQMIIDGYSYSINDEGNIRVLNLNDPEQTCVLLPDGTVRESTMKDTMLSLVQAYYFRNKEFLETEEVRFSPFKVADYYLNFTMASTVECIPANAGDRKLPDTDRAKIFIKPDGDTVILNKGNVSDKDLRTIQKYIKKNYRTMLES